MKNYIVKLLFNINIDEGNDRSQFDEQIRVIRAWSAEDAFMKAKSLGREEEEIFLNAENKLVKWQFVDVMELYALDDMIAGQLLFSTSHQAEDHQSYIKFIKQRSMEVQIKHLSFA